MTVIPSIPGYAIQYRLAAGRHGAVWAGQRLSDNIPVAMKVVPGEQVRDTARFLREAAVLATIDHPHVVPCLASGCAGDLLWLAMELATGDLAVEMRAGPADPSAVLAVGRDAAAGLADLHARGLVHRDITPANLLRMSDGRVALGDFGLVSGDHERLTRDGEVLGTPAYLSPEQAAGTAADARSDIYALGAVLYAMATGQPPYRGENTWGMLSRIAAGPFPDPREVRPDLPLQLRAIIRAATGLGPGERYQDVALLAADCDAVLHGGIPRHAGAVRARLTVAEAVAPVPVPSRRLVRCALLSAAGLAFGTGLGWLVCRPDQAERAAFASAVAQGDAAAWQAYAERFPEGAGINAARRALAAWDEPMPQVAAEHVRLVQQIATLEVDIERLRQAGTR